MTSRFKSSAGFLLFYILCFGIFAALAEIMEGDAYTLGQTETYVYFLLLLTPFTQESITSLLLLIIFIAGLLLHLYLLDEQKRFRKYCFQAIFLWVCFFLIGPTADLILDNYFYEPLEIQTGEQDDI